METQDWRTEAACRDMDPELFAPPSYEGPGAVQAEAAKAVCAGCPVTSECLQGAIAQEDDTTVRGGMTPGERRALRLRDLPRRVKAAA